MADPMMVWVLDTFYRPYVSSKWTMLRRVLLFQGAIEATITPAMEHIESKIS
jgi:molybdopterin-biosynthesis enzyme MoeA-like protein